MRRGPARISAADVTELGASLGPLSVGLVGQCVNPGRINPPVIEVEQGAHGDGEIERFVRPTGCTRSVDIGSGDRRRRMVHLVDETKQRLVSIVETG